MKAIHGALALALAGLGSAGLMLAAAGPVAAQPGTDVNGWNVRTVWFAGGQYVRQADGSWAELNRSGQVAFRFAEMQRDEWSVYLNDPSRNVQIQLDLFRRKISYGTGGGPRSDLYDITGASRGGGMASAPPPPPPPPPPRVRLVNAGPIWNQADAQNKCPVAAYAVGGRWTGQWRTTQEGRMSVCEIAD
ncbi:MULTISPECIES: mannan-binding lectin [unclassified Novosphingobium]|uniref:mannan-binding lectin n=1 Tax=unclassified Novosphingobium TaxID=2644732 RepID=UPI0025EA3B4E|nr:MULTISPECIES: mannan-binding lectin [unclassified Novosphingobium]HQV04419.1 mannan-binding lectin [Novosphingobium sp.]